MALEYGLILEQKILLHWMDILMQRVFKLTFLYDFWLQIKEKQTQY